MPGKQRQQLNWLDRLMVAVTFAEAGDRKTALAFLNEKPVKMTRKQNKRRVERRAAEERPVLKV